MSRIEQLHTKQFVKTLSPTEQQIIQRLYQEIAERREDGDNFQEQIDAAINRIRLLEEKTANLDGKLKSILAIDFRDFVTREEHVGVGGIVHPVATLEVNGFMSSADKEFIETLKKSSFAHEHPNLSLLDKLMQSGDENEFDLSLLGLSHDHENKNVLDKITESVVRGTYDLNDLHTHTNQKLLNKLTASDNKAQYDLANLGQSHDHENKDVLDMLYKSGSETSFDLSKISDMHKHGNKLILDRITQSGTETSFDLSNLTKVHDHTNKSLLDKIVATVSESAYDLSYLHEHSNLEDIERMGISSSNLLTIDGVEQSLHSHTNKKLLDKVVSSKNRTQHDLAELHKHANYEDIERIGISTSGIITIDGVEVEDSHDHTNLSILEKIVQSGGETVLDLSRLHKHGNSSILNKIIQSGSEIQLDLSELSKAHTHSNKALLDILMKTGVETSFDLSDLTDHETRIAELETAVGTNDSGGGGGSLSSTVNDHEKRIDNLELEMPNKEDKANKGIANGYAGLDGSGWVPLSQLPPNAKREIKVVSTIVDRDALVTYEGMRVHVLDASNDATVDSGWAEYIHNGTSFTKTAEKESIDVILDWANIVNKKLASSTDNGLMTSTDFTKLQGIEDGANKYIHPTTHEALMITIEDTENNFVSDNVEGALRELAHKDGVPTGAIMMWHGISTIPAGWYICDGTNGTPDMSNHFISLSATPTDSETVVYIMKL